MSAQLLATPSDVSQTSLIEKRASPHITRRPLLAALMFGLAALALLLPGLGRPKTTFFDELYFVPEARALIQGIPNPTPYVSSLAKPPLGKVLMAVGMKLAGDNSFGWRLSGAVCGAFTVTAIFLWTWLLLRDMSLAALAAALALFNNFLFVMSRIATVDVFLLFFLTWSLVGFTASLALEMSPTARRILFCMSGALLGMGGAVKWNAIDTLAACWFVVIALAFVRRPQTMSPGGSLFEYAQRLRHIGPIYVLAGLLVAPVLCYSLAFWPICRVLHLPFTPREVVDINAYMWRFNKTTEVNPFIIMAWYRWPLNLHPQRALSYLVGNPLVTWGGLAALVGCVVHFFRKWAFPEGFVVLLFGLNFLQWVVTPQKGLYYYYYYPCVMFLGAAIAIVVRHRPRLFGIRISVLVGLAAAIVFARCYGQMAHLEAPWDCMLGCFPFN
jgi:dolichyl-phosphate-mannose-protein mannosyltransferase